MITFHPIKNSWIRVRSNNTIIGEIQRDFNNSHNFYPAPFQGFTAEELLSLYAELSRLNTSLSNVEPCPS